MIDRRSYELQGAEYTLHDCVKDHLCLGQPAAEVVLALLNGEPPQSARERLIRGQETIIRDLAKELGVRLPE